MKSPTVSSLKRGISSIGGIAAYLPGVGAQGLVADDAKKTGENTPLVGGQGDPVKVPESFYVVVMSVAFLQGILGLTSLAEEYLYKDEFKVSPSQLSLLTSLARIPWIIKPLWGFISDSFPLCGYRRKSYLILMALLMSFFYAIIPTIKLLWMFVAATTLTSCCLAFMNVIGKALLVEASAGANQAAASTFQTVFQVSLETGLLLSSYSSGFLLEFFTPRQLFAYTSFFPLAAVFTGILFQEKPQQGKKKDISHSSKLLLETFKSKLIWGPALFCFASASVPSSGAADFYFLTNELGFKPELLGRLKFVKSILSLFGLFLFQNYLKTKPYTKIILWTTVASWAVATPMDYVFATHLNRKIGVPDIYFAVCGSAIQAALSELHHLPMLVLAARICPAGIEGTLYALLMSLFNAGSFVSRGLGGVLIWMCGVTADKFDHYWLLLLICDTLLLAPLVLLPLVPSSDEQTNQGKSHQTKGKMEEVDDEERAPKAAT